MACSDWILPIMVLGGHLGVDSILLEFGRFLRWSGDKDNTEASGTNRRHRGGGRSGHTDEDEALQLFIRQIINGGDTLAIAQFLRQPPDFKIFRVLWI